MQRGWWISVPLFLPWVLRHTHNPRGGFLIGLSSASEITPGLSLYRSPGGVQSLTPVNPHKPSRDPGRGDAISSECNEMPWSFIREPGTGQTQWWLRKMMPGPESEAQSERGHSTKKPHCHFCHQEAPRRSPQRQGTPKFNHKTQNWRRGSPARPLHHGRCVKHWGSRSRKRAQPWVTILSKSCVKIHMIPPCWPWHTARVHHWWFLSLPSFFNHHWQPQFCLNVKLLSSGPFSSSWWSAPWGSLTGLSHVHLWPCYQLSKQQTQWTNARAVHISALKLSSSTEEKTKTAAPASSPWMASLPDLISQHPLPGLLPSRDTDLGPPLESPGPFLPRDLYMLFPLRWCSSPQHPEGLYSPFRS